MAGLDDAVQELYRAPLAQFVAERKRLAGALKRDGDPSAATNLLARKRPTISAWVVNQLYWHARAAFDDMLKTAERLRNGDLRGSADHREAIATLRQHASGLLRDAGHSPTESTLRRVTATLSALAVTGGFDPDPPGALAQDRDPPGFEAIGISEMPEPPPRGAQGSHHGDGDSRKKDGHALAQDGHPKDELAAARAKLTAAKKAREQEETDRRAEDMAEKKRVETERKRTAAESHRLEAALRAARLEQGERERDVKQIAKQLTAAQSSVDKAQAVVDDIERKLAELAEPGDHEDAN